MFAPIHYLQPHWFGLPATAPALPIEVPIPPPIEAAPIVTGNSGSSAAAPRIPNAPPTNPEAAPPKVAPANDPKFISPRPPFAMRPTVCPAASPAKPATPPRIDRV